MDLNIVVVAGRLMRHPQMEYDSNRRITHVRLNVSTTGAPKGQLYIVPVDWSATDDELASLHLLRDDRVWVAGYMTGSKVIAINVQKAEVTVNGDE